MQFEWDHAKARANLRNHGVAFEDARRVFDDPNALDRPDNRADYGEDRFTTTGMVDGRIWTVTFTEREDRIRIISARMATRREQDDYFRHED